VVEQELCCGIDCQAEKELLQIDSRTILLDVLEHKLKVALESFNVGDLIPSEVGPQQVTAVSPSLTICIENTVAQERSEGSLSVPETVVLELQTQYRLDVFRLARGNKRHGYESVVESVAESLEALSIFFQQDMVLAVIRHDLHVIDSKDGVFVELRRAWLATVLFLEALARKVECNSGV
jgi:hypothetical protein